MASTIRKVFLLALFGMALAIMICTAIPTTELTVADAKSIIDVHVHAAGIGAGNSGCFISRDLREGYKFKWYLQAFGVEFDELEHAGDARVLERLSQQIAASRWIGQAVVLAMDGIVGTDGELDRALTQVYVPNEFLVETLAKYDNLLFGASVNPYRRDALQRLEYVARHDAVLVKWIPAIMHIDPADPALEPFYRKLVALELPLLIHVGQERSFGPARDELGDPHKLELPLKLGVRVIAAHIATTGRNNGQDNFERILPLFKRFDNLYTDISSLTQINKRGYLYRGLTAELVADRMVYGSDWPLQFFPLVSPWYQIGHVPIGVIKGIAKIDNQWDRDVALKSAMGVPHAVFARTREVLGLD